MKIKKYEARTEQEAINKVKDDLGLDALILNIKKTQPKGIAAFFRKTIVEVTAAYEDKSEGSESSSKLFELPKLNPHDAEKESKAILGSKIPSLTGKLPSIGGNLPTASGNTPPLGSNAPPLGGGASSLGSNIPPLGGSVPPLGGNIPPLGGGTQSFDNKMDKLNKIDSFPTALQPSVLAENKREEERKVVDGTTEKDKKIKNLEEKLASTEGLLEKVVGELTASAQWDKNFNRKYENTMIQLFYDTLVSQGVTSKIAEEILDDIDSIGDDEKIDINLLVRVVYNTIINILGAPETVDVDLSKTEKTKYIVFIGPTGVGKTTTIAKLSSNFVLNHNLSVGLITADTYRIAAVEQLKTYADILGIDVGVVYNASDLKYSIQHMSKVKDLILIDTAGRSHKNEENLRELGELVACVPEGEKYLVLSLTTKYEDLLNIIGKHSTIADFKIIFTKLDETTCLGSILNICYTTGKKISYITYGQNVPEDIEVIQPEKIAKVLLGVGGDI